jgi:hypothetical protein
MYPQNYTVRFQAGKSSHFYGFTLDPSVIRDFQFQLDQMTAEMVHHFVAKPTVRP